MRQRLSRCSVVGAVAVLALAAALGVAACGAPSGAGRTASSDSPASLAAGPSSTPSGSADELMAQAKALAARTDHLEALLWEDHMMAALISEDASGAAPELVKARALLKQIRTNERAMVSLLEQVVRLDPGKRLATYAGQQREIAELRLRSMGLVDRLLTGIETLFREKGKPGQADVDKLFAGSEAVDPGDPVSQLEEKTLASVAYFKQSGLPERYYINNGLGEAYDTPNGQTEEEALAIPAADGIRFGAAVKGEGSSWEIRGTFDMPSTEAMQAEREALESDGWTVEAGSTGEIRDEMTARNSLWEAAFTFERAGGAGAGSGDGGTLVVRMTEL